VGLPGTECNSELRVERSFSPACYGLKTVTAPGILDGTRGEESRFVRRNSWKRPHDERHANLYPCRHRQGIPDAGEPAAEAVPYIVVATVNNLAFRVMQAERANMQQVFHHPCPYTVNSVVVDKVTKGYPTATVRVRPEVAKYIAPYEFGALHVLPGRAALVPGDGRASGAPASSAAAHG
jgi:hypothetical protein